MSSNPSRKHDQQGFASEEALRAVMSGVYYRHEFARRNEDVVKASEDLMDFFPKTKQQRAKLSAFTFETSEGLKTLTDLLVDECNDNSGKEGKRKRNALTAFLEEHRVMPISRPEPNMMHPNAGSFLQYPCQLPEKDAERMPALRGIRIRKERLYFEYLKVLAFETFAVTDLGMGQPIFMPFIPILKDGTTLKKVFPCDSSSDAQPAHIRLALINYDLPRSTLRNHFEMQMSRADFSFTKAGSNSKSNLLLHIPWPSLDGYLAVLDWECNEQRTGKNWYDGSKALPGFIEEKELKQKDKLKNPEKEGCDAFDKWLGEKYGDWRKKALSLLDKYKSII